jgi:site-specific DNA recombinase
MFLFSGLLKCALCGGNLVIVSGHAPGRHPKYGCSQHHYRGACPNVLMVRRNLLEEMLLSGLQQQVLQPEVIQHTVDEFGRQVRVALSHMQEAEIERERRKSRLESQLSRLVATAAETGPSEFLVKSIRDRERVALISRR